MKNNNGMGMIKLIVTILFIILLVATAVYFVRMKYNETQIETIKTDMLQVQWKLKDHMDKQTVKGEEKQYLGTKLSESSEDALLNDFLNKNIISEEDYDKYYVLRDEDLALAGLEITNYENSYFIINYETYEILVTQGCRYSEDEVLYRLSDIIAKTN